MSVGPWVGRVEFWQGFNASHFTDTLYQAQKILCWDVVEMFNSTLNVELIIINSITVFNYQVLNYLTISETKAVLLQP